MTGTVSSSLAFSDVWGATDSDITGIEHPLFFGIESFATSKGTEIINNMYYPTKEYRLDTLISLGL
ncbi:hypothetical protein DDE83_008819 [Stemphylium lycopersici]|uniref:Uncharacterized protein n=1 Tax=Stemphylium lycopersici TaxID=183478 RepID=A0A364MT44_STELY|nr:hypothetical protein DDE83_008819 [Stemphylium lycopersici]